LGGAAFVPILLIGLVALWWSAALPLVSRAAYLAGAIALFTVSLVDDFYRLSTTNRFIVQFAVAGAIVGATLTAQPVGVIGVVEVFIAGILIIGVVGLLNVYNFMDGIDGLAGLQAVVAGLAWWVCARYLGAPAAGSLGLVLAAGAMGFLTLNWPPAKIFMGDAGSTVLGFSFAVLPLLVWVEKKPAVGFYGLLSVALLVVWPFLADGTFTILRRLKNRENILRAHRSHLYQRLVIAGKSHRLVTVVYGVLAAIGAGLGWGVVSGLPYATIVAVGVVAGLFIALWQWTVVTEREYLDRK
jgi:UDP-N-acetylmuramyl pentapeptide phosphotransferase/UDP-N-acetylglucosamine-1-phosphate transferase